MSQHSPSSPPAADHNPRPRRIRKPWGVRLAAVMVLHAVAITFAVWFFRS